MTSVHSSNDTRIFYKECTSLARAGYAVYLVAPGESREGNGVHVVGVGQPSGGRLSRMVGFSKRVYQKALEIDAEIYHIHDPELLPYALKLKRKGKKVIFDSHENSLHQMSDKEWIPQALRRMVSSIYYIYAVYVFQQMNALISVTPDIVEELKSHNSNTWLVANYPLCEGKTSIAFKSTSDFRLCFTGGIERQWCHSEIINAIDDLGKVRYVLCGRADAEYLSELNQLPGWSAVDYRGKVAYEESQKVQQQANAGVAILALSKNTCGRKGTLGNTKLFEYMLNGIPVICTDFELWRDIVDKHQCGICVDPSSQTQIRDAVVSLMNNVELSKLMGQNGRKAVEQEFNWETQEKKLLRLYCLIEKG